MSDDFEDLAASTYRAELYPAGPPIEGADAPSFGICLSGGGSRALSCALGQLSGLRSLPDPADPKRSIIDRVAHLSSVSGGSWASVIYSFLPPSINGKPVGDDQLLISPTDPAALVKQRKHHANPANVAYMDPMCLGTAPQRFDLKVIAELLHTMYKWGLFRDKVKWNWFWIAAVGELILKPFGLYGARYDPDKDFPEPERFFSLSAEYIDTHITPWNPSLDPAQFNTVRPGRPSLVVNTNLLMNSTEADPPQTPVQATPIEAGILGLSPDGSLVGGGSVESFAFTSTFENPDGGAAVTLERRYSLCDIAGCSSVFFAEFLLQYLNEGIEEILSKLEEILPLPKKLAQEFTAKLRAELEGFLDTDVSNLIPRYNYWPLAATGADANVIHGFSDGGDFENTGILGMLARTDANRIVAFVNSEDRLHKDPASGEVMVSGQLALLFGYQADPVAGKYVSYGGMSAAQPMSYVQVFQDRGAFAQLRRGLFEASCGGSEADANLGSHTVAFTQTLTTVENQVAHIRGGREVRVLWVYNNRVNQWQDAITDAGIREDLAQGQSNQHRDGTPNAANGRAHGPLANFPWYSTSAQVHIDKEGVNMLAQLSAWNVRQLEAQINALVGP